MSGGSSNSPPTKCGLFELLVFIAAIVTGTACSILSKTMMQLQGEGMTNEQESEFHMRARLKRCLYDFFCYFDSSPPLIRHILIARRSDFPMNVYLNTLDGISHIIIIIPPPPHCATVVRFFFALWRIFCDHHYVGLNNNMTPSSTEHRKVFNKPIFQTFGMFVGMCFGLVMHFVVMIFQIPFPGYDIYYTTTPSSTSKEFTTTTTTIGAISEERDPLVPKNSTSNPKDVKSSSPPPTIPVWMYFFLAIPAIFDLAATALCMMGLQYIDVSIYQLLRGSGTLWNIVSFLL
jgi:hypothetical protein